MEQQLLKIVGGYWEMAERLIAKVREKFISDQQQLL